MAWLPIANTPPQYHYQGEPASGYVLKFYRAGTTTNINLATDNTGGTTASDAPLNAEGFPEISGTVIIPHLEESYKVSLYPTQSAADSDTGFLWAVDNLTPPVNTVTSVDELVKVSANDTTADNLDVKVVSGTNITVTEENDGSNESLSINLPTTITGDHTLDGDLSITGTVDGRDVAADGVILDGLYTPVSAVTGHVKAGNMQIWAGGDQSPEGPLFVTSNWTSSTFETVGRTGSGADNIWTSLDQVPSNATIIIVDAALTVSPSGTSPGLVNFNARLPSATSGGGQTDWEVAKLSVDPDSDVGDYSITVRCYLPYDGTATDIMYFESNSDNTTVNLYYRGFIVD